MRLRAVARPTSSPASRSGPRRRCSSLATSHSRSRACGLASSPESTSSGRGSSPSGPPPLPGPASAPERGRAPARPSPSALARSAPARSAWAWARGRPRSLPPASRGMRPACGACGGPSCARDPPSCAWSSWACSLQPPARRSSSRARNPHRRSLPQPPSPRPRWSGVAIVSWAGLLSSLEDVGPESKGSRRRKQPVDSSRPSRLCRRRSPAPRLQAPPAAGAGTVKRILG